MQTQIKGVNTRASESAGYTVRVQHVSITEKHNIMPKEQLWLFIFTGFMEQQDPPITHEVEAKQCVMTSSPLMGISYPVCPR